MGRSVPERPGILRPKVISRVSVIDSIVAEIKDKIVSGELRDGDVLASQDDMARSLGVSRASLREALNRLSLMGLVEMRHGSGTFIRSASPHDFMNSLSPLLISDRSSVAELLEARYHVESAVAGLAALHAGADDQRQLRHLLERMERDVEAQDTEGFIAHDLQFHMLVAESSKNRVLVKIVEILRDLLRQCINRFATEFPERLADTVAYHARICAAIEDQDADEARRAMEEHIRFLISLNDRHPL